MGSPDLGQIACSCGTPGCRELGWPHEWDPIAADDDCTLGHGPGSGGLRAFFFGDPDPAFVRVDPGGYDGPLLEVRHAVREPYVRWGSGYACAACATRSGEPDEPTPAPVDRDAPAVVALRGRNVT